MGRSQVSAHNPEEDAAIDRIDGQNLVDLFRILQIDIHEVLKAIDDVKRAGMVPVSIGIPNPYITVLGLPLEFEQNCDDIMIYTQDKSQLN